MICNYELMLNSKEKISIALFDIKAGETFIFVRDIANYPDVFFKCYQNTFVSLKSGEKFEIDTGWEKVIRLNQVNLTSPH